VAVAERAALEHLLAVIGDQDHRGSIGDAQRGQIGEHLSERRVRVSHFRVVKRADVVALVGGERSLPRANLERQVRRAGRVDAGRGGHALDCKTLFARGVRQMRLGRRDEHEHMAVFAPGQKLPRRLP